MRTSDNPLGLRPFDAARYLDSDEMVAEFIAEALEDGDPEVLLNALQIAARARGMQRLADESGLARENLYKALAPGAKPRYDTILKVIGALGVKLTAQPAASQAPSKASAAKRVRKPATTRKPATAARAAAKG